MQTIQANTHEQHLIMSALDSYSRLFAYSDYDQYKELRALLWRIEQETAKKGLALRVNHYE